MAGCAGLSIVRVAGSALVLAAAALIQPSLAEAQSRGTLQVSATVVDSRASFQTLGDARKAVRNWSSLAAHDSAAVSTLAQISMTVQSVPASATRAESAPSTSPTLVVSIDFLKN